MCGHRPCAVRRLDKRQEKSPVTARARRKGQERRAEMGSGDRYRSALHAAFLMGDSKRQETSPQSVHGRQIKIKEMRPELPDLIAAT